MLFPFNLGASLFKGAGVGVEVALYSASSIATIHHHRYKIKKSIRDQKQEIV